MYFRCKVAFLNTDKVSFAHETINGNSFHNEGESKIIKLVRETDDDDIIISKILYLSPYIFRL